MTTDLYAEILNEHHLPKKDSDRVFVFSALLEDGAVPYIALDNIAQYVL